MVTLIPTTRKSAVLTPSALACLSAVPTINITAGCAHGCIYCYTRGYSTHPGWGRVALYTNTLEKLKRELARRRIAPKAVYFSPSSDAFQPIPEVLEMTYEVMQFLLNNGVGVAFLTKGRIPEPHMKLLIRNAESVRAQIGVTSLDQSVLETLEPHAPPPLERLAQAATLTVSGVPTEVRLDPIVPGITDSPESIQALLGAVKTAGVTRIAVSALFLRTSILGRKAGEPADARGVTLIRDVYRRFYGGAKRLRIHAERSEVLALPKDTREAIYKTIKDISEDMGLSTSICACKNPDICTGTCNIAGDWSEAAGSCRRGAQAELFEE